jgi:hypothetical protein
MAVLDHAGTLLRMMACPVPPRGRHKLGGARRAAAVPPRPAGPSTIQRRVSSPRLHHWARRYGVSEEANCNHNCNQRRLGCHGMAGYLRKVAGAGGAPGART